MGVASLVLGIIALIIGVFSAGYFGWLGAILALVGVILGASANKGPEKSTLAIVGLVVSVVALIICLILYVACIACAGLWSFVF